MAPVTEHRFFTTFWGLRLNTAGHQKRANDISVCVTEKVCLSLALGGERLLQHPLRALK